MIRSIAGRQNHTVKLARKLQKKSFRRQHGLLVGEGMDLLHAAVKAGARVREVLVRRDLVDRLPQALRERAESSEFGRAAVDIGTCEAEILKHASLLGGAADVVFVSEVPAWSLADIALPHGFTLFLDGIGDPGNVGTLLRSCLAFGGVGVLCSPETADPYGPKALRGGMGAQFLLPVVTDVKPLDLRARLEAMDRRGEDLPTVVVADPHQGEDVRAFELKDGGILVLGSERAGPVSQWEDARRVTIPLEHFDSLNVAMAGTIIAYELCGRIAKGAVANRPPVR